MDDLLMRGIPECVVVQHARQVCPRRQNGFQRPLDRLLQRAPVNFVLHAARESHLLERPVEMPVPVRGVRVANHPDLPRVAATEPELVRQSDELNVFERIESHQLCRNGVDRHLVGGREDHVLHVRDHAARPGPVAGERAVHHREDAAVNFFLDHQKVDQRLVDHRMRPVPLLIQQAAERVFHRAGRRRENMRLDGGQVDDVFADKPLRDHESVGINLVQAQELIGQVPDRIPHVDPFVAFVKMDVFQPVSLDDRQLLVLPLAEVRVDHHGPVVTAVDFSGIVAIPLQRPDHAIQLPRSRRTGRVEKVPTDVDLQRRFPVLRQGFLVARQVHHPVDIGKNGGRTGRQNRYG